MARLRDPQRGCPWDLQQNFKTIAPYTVEEAYEVADAIERDDLPSLRDELGDLLFQVVFHSQLAQEQGAFDFDAMWPTPSATRWNAAIRMCSATHPSPMPKRKRVAWEEQKRRERARRRRAEQASVLDDVPGRTCLR